MGIAVIVGPDIETRRRRLLQELSGHGQPVLITRTPALSHDLARSLAMASSAAGDHEGVAQMPVYSWRRFVEDLWLSFGDGRTIIDDAARMGVISRVVDARQPVGPDRPRDLLDYSGGRRLLADLVQTIGARELTDALGRGGLHRNVLAAAARCAEAERLDGYIEFPDVVEYLSCAECAPFSAVGFTGFVSLSDSELGLIARLAADGASVLLDLPDGKGVAALEPGQSAVSRLEDVGASIVALPGDEECVGWRVGVAGMLAAESCLPVELLVEESITLAVADDLQAEAVLVADRVENTIKQGVLPDQIVVLVRNNKQILRRLIPELERRNLPYAVNASMPLGSTGLGAAFVQLLRLALALDREGEPSDGAAATVHLMGAFLTSAYSGMETGDANRIDAGARAFSRPPVEIAADVARSRSTQPGFGPQSPIGRIAPGTRRWGGARVPEENAIEWKLIADCLLQNAQQATRSSWWGSRQDECAHAAIAGIIGSMLELGAQLDPDELLEQCLETQVPVGPSPHSRGRVVVGSAGAVAGRTFESVVICGLAAEIGTTAERSGSDRIAEESGIALGAAPTVRRALEDYAVLAGAISSVHLVWRESDRRDDQVERSALLDGILAAFGANPAAIGAVLRALRGGRREDSERLIASAIDECNLSPEEAERTSLVVAHIRRAHGTDPGVLAARCGASPTRTPQYEAPESCAPGVHRRGVIPIVFPEGYWEGRVLSPSAVENYVRCPYRWFLDSVLRTYALDDEFDAAAQGSAIHRVLELFYVRWVRELEHAELTVDDLPSARALFSDVVAEVVAELADPGSKVSIPGPSSRIEVELALESAWSIIEADASCKLYPPKTKPFRPTYFEWRFGSGAREDDVRSGLRSPDVHPDPVTVAGVSFAGTIDRIDTYRDPETGEELLAVVDYKASKGTTVNGLTMLERAKVQVPLYLLIAQEALGIRPALGGYAFYKSDDNMRYFASAELAGSQSSIKGDAFYEGLDAVRALVGDTVAGMRSGVIEPVIGQKRAEYASCGFCADKWCPEHISRGGKW